MREEIQIGIYGLEKISLLVTSHQPINENNSHMQLDTVTRTKIQSFSNLTHNLSCQLSFEKIYPITLMACNKSSYHHTRELSTNLTQFFLRKIDTQSQLTRFQLNILVTRFLDLDAYKCTHQHEYVAQMLKGKE